MCDGCAVKDGVSLYAVMLRHDADSVMAAASSQLALRAAYERVVAEVVLCAQLRHMQADMEHDLVYRTQQQQQQQQQAQHTTTAHTRADLPAYRMAQSRLRQQLCARVCAVTRHVLRRAHATFACTRSSRRRQRRDEGRQQRHVTAMHIACRERWAGWRYYTCCVCCRRSRNGKNKAGNDKDDGDEDDAEHSLGVWCWGGGMAATPVSSDDVRAHAVLCGATVLTAELRYACALRDAAAARARVRALRANDADAYAQHVSLLKVSALLHIMQLTDAFVKRIGLRLHASAQEQQQQQQEWTNASHNNNNNDSDSDNNAATTATTDYERFKAYVASARGEYRLMHSVDVFVATAPRGLRATLLPHQMDGLRFLASLHANGINGILADEMGVGKTMQTLAFLLHLKEQHEHTRDAATAAASTSGAPRRVRAVGPHLVLAPLSVVREWHEAWLQFACPALQLVCLDDILRQSAQATTRATTSSSSSSSSLSSCATRTKTHRAAAAAAATAATRLAADCDIVLLPVHAVRRALPTLLRVPWDYVVVDEAHKAVAHPHTDTARAIARLPCRRRLVLTGTPLNSDLSELWALLHFLNPRVFTAGDAFDVVFRQPFAAAADGDAATAAAAAAALTSEERGLLVLRLHQILRPFLLRRTKRDVDATLRMTRHTIVCPLTCVQQTLLQLLRERKRTPCVHTCSSSSSSEEDEDESSADAQGAAACVCDNDDDDDKDDAAAATTTRTSDCRKRRRRRRSSTRSTHYGLTTAHVSLSTARRVCSHACLLPFCAHVLQQEQQQQQEEQRSDAEATPPSRACSGKFLLLHVLLRRLWLAQRKAVLFTHWLDCVDLLLDELHACGWGDCVEVLSGNVAAEERRRRVARFRDDATCLFFVVSMMAGGCGINLQTAHLVVLLDRDHTSTNEEQALGRVFRMGQRHTVRAVYLTTNDDAEARVVARARRKDAPRLALIERGDYQVTHTSATKDDDDDDRDDDNGDDEEAAAAVQDEGNCAAAASCDDHVIDAAAMLLSATSGNTNNDGNVSATRQACCASAAQWRALRTLVQSLDALVLTEEDRADGTLPRRLAAHLPPVVQEDDNDNNNNNNNDDNNTEDVRTMASVAAEWGCFWRVWHTAMCAGGPPPLREALTRASRDEAATAAAASHAAARQRRAERNAARLRLATLDVPSRFARSCAACGIDDADAVAALYAKTLHT